MRIKEMITKMKKLLIVRQFLLISPPVAMAMYIEQYREYAR